MSFEGDKTLSGFDRHMWSLCYSTLERFGCLTMFKVQGPYPQQRIDRLITFYVPGTHPRAFEVYTYLEDELREDIALSHVMEEQYIPGTQVRVEYFGGIAGYMTHEEMRPLIEKAVASLMEGLQARTRKPQ